jgi:hypothetical protein
MLIAGGEPFHVAAKLVLAPVATVTVAGCKTSDRVGRVGLTLFAPQPTISDTLLNMAANSKVARLILFLNRLFDKEDDSPGKDPPQ